MAFLWNPDHLDNGRREAEHAAQVLGMELQSFEARDADNLTTAYGAIANARVDALYVVSSRLMAVHIGSIVSFAVDNRLPMIGG